MFYTHTLDEVRNNVFLDNLMYCLCGKYVKDRSHYDYHIGCVHSGISRGLFKHAYEWLEYCKWNGARVAEYFKITIPE